MSIQEPTIHCPLLCFIEKWLDNPKWWFCPRNSFDNHISTTYGHIIDTYYDIHTLNERQKRALCIAYDQLPRHIYRNQRGNHIIQFYLLKSLEIFNCLSSIDNVHGEELCFILLPLRHTNDITNIFKATEIIWKRQDPNATYKKFLKASYQRCPIIGGGSWEYKQVLNYPNTILDYNGSMHMDIQFDSTNEVVKSCCKLLHVKNRYIISLSGGVDSMVGAYITAHSLGMERCCFLHINYNNRDTSNDEEDFVRYWSFKWGITLYVRKFTEINRPLCMEYDMRDVYETYTRDVRYACYKEVITSLDSTTTAGNSKVILLHNKDDCFENILTNITQKNKYENLLGMTHESIQDGICFLRPFLNTPKSHLIKYAQTHGIPYLYDSTPKWSQRGQIRDNIVPVLTKWNTDCLPAFFELSDHIKGLHSIVDEYVSMIMTDVVQYDDGHIEIKAIKELPRDIAVWRKIISTLNLPQPSSKSIQSFVNRKFGKGHLSKELNIEFSNNTMIFTKSVSSFLQ
jgi:tRNA(Ile)-lysidine synthetase-like protein